jgi:hypothetical protein
MTMHAHLAGKLFRTHWGGFARGAAFCGLAGGFGLLAEEASSL